MYLGTWKLYVNPNDVYALIVMPSILESMAIEIVEVLNGLYCGVVAHLRRMGGFAW
jgi:hypothetical protein